MNENEKTKSINIGDEKFEENVPEQLVGNMADPFSRRSSLLRTPPSRYRAHSLSDLPVERVKLPWEDGEIESEKRKRSDDTPPQEVKRKNTSPREEWSEFLKEKTGAEENNTVQVVDIEDDGTKKKRRKESPEIEDVPNEVRVFRNLIEKLTKTSSQLKVLISKNSNTKVEIKKGVSTMSRQVEDIKGGMEELERYMMSKKRRSKGCAAKGIGTQTENIEKVKTADMGTQTNLEYGEVCNTLDGANTLEELSMVLDREWPEEVYERTMVEIGNPAKAGGEGDIAIVVDPSDKGEKGLLREMEERFPEIKTLMDMKPEQGQTEYLVNTTRTRTSRGGEDERTRYVYLLFVERDEGVADIKKFYDTVIGWKQMLHKHKRKSTSIAVPEYVDREYARKILENIFRGTEVTIKLLVPQGKGKVDKIGAPRRQKSRPPEGRVVVRAKEGTFADLLKNVKSRVDIGKVGVEVKQVKKTTSGDLLLVIEGGSEKADALGEEIREKIQNAEVRTRKEETTTLFVLGIDAVTEKEEIAAEIRKATNVGDGEVTIKTLKPGGYGTQAATIEIPRGKAADIIRAGNIKIGWTRCTIKERVEIVRCFRCLNFGHKAQGCRGQNRADECVKCGEKNHKAKDCVNKPFCTVCKASGHRADQMKCPAFKKLIEERRSLRPGRKRPN